MLFDLHIHSEYSYDSFSKIDDILRIAKKRGLSGIAITDHEEFKGSLEAYAKARYYDLLVIPGMEVATEHGDIVGLFLKQKVTGKTFMNVVTEIKEQNGIVALVHPFKRANEIPDVLLSDIDLIEVFNARGESIGSNQCNQRAYELSLKRNIPVMAGSDAHFLFEIGRGGIDLGNVSKLEQVKQSLLSYNEKLIVRNNSSIYLDVFSQFIKAYKTNDIKVYKSAFKRFLKTLKWKTYWQASRLGLR